MQTLGHRRLLTAGLTLVLGLSVIGVFPSVAQATSPQTLTWAPTTAIEATSSPQSPTPATALDNAVINYSVTGFTTRACTVNATSGELTFNGVGTCTVRATAAATANYDTASKDVVFMMYGTAWGWGNNNYTQIGTDISPYEHSLPVETWTSNKYVAISSYGQHSCALGINGAAYCWGEGYPNYMIPRAPSALTMPSGATFTSISTGRWHACAVATTGAAYCWGYNSDRQLGDGTYSYRANPTAVQLPAGVTVTAIAAGTSHSCALATTGVAYCWGYALGGLLGRDAPAIEADPGAVSMPAGVTFTAITTGTLHSCALGNNGKSYCWGYNGEGRLGDGTNENRYVPTEVASAGVTFTSISAGATSTCGLTAAGAAYCWGDNAQSQIGDGTGTNRAVPTAVTGGRTFQSIAVGSAHVCATTTTNTYCWGSNGNGRLGDGTMTSRSTPTRVYGPSFLSVSSAESSTMALAPYPQAVNWYPDANLLATESTFRPVLATASDGASITYAVTSYTTTTCAVDSSTAALTITGMGMCTVRATAAATSRLGSAFVERTFGSSARSFGWGSAPYREIGGATNQSTPVATSGGRNYIDLSLGYAHTCAVDTTGNAYCWGLHAGGQLGHSNPDIYNPQAVTMPAGVAFRSVATGSEHTCAVSTDGDVYCWGGNGKGQLGNGTNVNASVPTLVSMPPDVDFTTISGKGKTVCAVSTAGDGYCWGWNYYGNVGDGTTDDTNVPTLVSMPPNVDFRSISVGEQHACALSTGGAAYCWGNNGNGELGIGNGSFPTTPTAVVMPSSETFSAIDVDYNSSCAVGASGAGYCWGDAQHGVLGNNSSAGSRNTPGAVVMPASTSFVDISVGRATACATTTVGSSYCWGWNSSKKIGNGTSTDSTVPTLTSGTNRYLQVHVGYYATVALGAYSQTVSWSPTTTVTTTQSPLTPSASATTDGPGTMSYSFVGNTTATCSVNASNGQLTYTGPGTCTVRATASPTTSVASATKDVTFTVSRAAQTVTWAPTTAIKTTSSPLTPSNPATALGGAAITYSVARYSTAACSVQPTSGLLTYYGVGTCTVRATAAETLTYGAASTEDTFVVTRAAQTVTWAPTSAITTTQSPLTPSTLASALGSPDITYAVTGFTNRHCSVGSTSGVLTYGGIGDCTVRATAAEDDTYLSATADVTFTVSRATQVVTWAPSTSLTTLQSPLTPTSPAQALGDVPVTYSVTAFTNRSCTVNSTNGQLTYAGVGDCTVRASAQLDDTHTDGSTDVTFTVSRATQGITWSPTTSLDTLGSPNEPSVQAFATGGHTVSYSVLSSTTSSCSVDSVTGVLTYSGAGDCTVRAATLQDDTWSAGTRDVTFTVALVPQTVTWSPVTSVTTLHSPLMPSAPATALDSAAITYSVTGHTTTSCTVNTSSGQLTYAGTGTCTVRATSAPTAIYAGGFREVTFTITKTAEALSWTPTTTVTTVSSPVTPQPPTKSGPGVLAYSVVGHTTQACSVGSATGRLTFTGSGTCTVEASVPETTHYLDDTVQVTFTINRALQTVTWTPTTAILTTDSPVTPTAATALGSAPISYAVTAHTTHSCTVDGTSGAVTYSGAGTCTVRATAAETVDYATGFTDVIFTSSRATPTLTWSPSLALVATDDSAVFAAASTASDDTITYVVTNAGATGCAVNSVTRRLTFSHAGSCTVTAEVGQSRTYASVSTTATFAISRQVPGVAWSPASSALTTASPLSLATATTTGNGSITYSATSNGSEGCSFANPTTPVLTFVNAGSCTITATSGQTTRFASGTATETITLSRGTPTVTWTPATTLRLPAGTRTPTAASTSGNGAITYAVTSDNGAGCSVRTSTGAISYTGLGQCSITATSAVTGRFVSASTSVIFTVELGLQDIDVQAGRRQLAPGESTTVSAPGATSTGAVTWALIDGPDHCALDDTTLTAISDGLCTVQVQVQADADYAAADDSITFTIATAPPPAFAQTPSEPLGVWALPGDAEAVVSWSAPASEGAFAVTTYQVVASPGGRSCMAPGLAHTCTVTGLMNGTAYTFTVRALTGAGWGSWSAASGAVTPKAVTPSLMITGSRITRDKASYVVVSGVGTSLPEPTVQAHVRSPGQGEFAAGALIPLGADGNFTWQRRAKKKITIYFTSGDVASNRLSFSSR